MMFWKTVKHWEAEDPQTLILSPQKISITNGIETQSNLDFEFHLKTRYLTNGEMDVHLLLSLASQSPAA
jgi:hypothetical protein